MPEDKLILIGGGGHCRSCIDVIEASGNYIVEGIIDRKEAHVKYPVIGNDDDLKTFISDDHYFLVTVGQVKDSSLRKKLFSLVTAAGGKFATIISPTAYVASSAELGEGTICLHHSLVNANALIGINCIINSKALVEHDSVIGDHCHISTAAVVNGGCKIGNSCFIGSNAVIVNGIEICNDTVIGAGSVVTKNIVESGVYAGSPAKRIN